MASFDDIMTVAQRLVQAVNTIGQTYLNVQGQSNLANITAVSVVKATGGRVAAVSVIVAGSADGMIYDATATTDTSKPLWVIPMTVGVTFVNLPAQYGIVAAPGTGQTVTVSYS